MSVPTIPTEARLVRLRLVVTSGPTVDSHTVFGLQEKSGAVVEGRGGPDGSRVFECEVRAVPSAGTAQPNFLGPFTHGTPKSRHLYLSHGTRESGTAWVKRIKVPLASITWAMIDQAHDGALETDVDGRAAATVRVTWRIGGNGTT